MTRRRRERETAAAFGDEPSRDVEAEFGATVSASGSVAAKLGPVLPVVQKKTVGPVLPVVQKKTVVAKPVAAVAKPTSAAKPAVATTAQTGNFLEGGAALALPKVLAPSLTAAQQAAAAKALATARQSELASVAAKTSSVNAAYNAQRAADAKLDAQIHATLLATDPAYAAREKAIAKAGIDTAQITMGAKVLATGAAVIASGGAAAGAVGLTTGGAALASAAAADRLVAAAEKGGAIAKTAKGVIDDAKAAAKKGSAVAKQAVATVEAVAKERADKLIPKGVEQALTGEAKAAANRAVDALTGSVTAQLSANLAAAASAAPSSPSSRQYTQLAAGRRPVVANVAATNRLNAATVIDAPARPRWLVATTGKVTDIDAVPAAVSSKGFVVWTNGKVVKQ